MSRDVQESKASPSTTDTPCGNGDAANRRPEAEPRKSKKAKTANNDRTSKITTAPVAHKIPSSVARGTAASSMSPQILGPSATLPSPSSPQLPHDDTKLQAEIETLRTKLRAAKAEARAFEDENMRLTGRALNAERQVKETDQACRLAKQQAKEADEMRRVAELDTEVWRAHAEVTRQEADEMYDDRLLRAWIDAQEAEEQAIRDTVDAGARAENEIAEARQRARKKVAAAEERARDAERRAKAAEAGRARAEKLLEAYKLVLDDRGWAPEEPHRRAKAGADESSTSPTRSRAKVSPSSTTLSPPSNPPIQTRLDQV